LAEKALCKCTGKWRILLADFLSSSLSNLTTPWWDDVSRMLNVLVCSEDAQVRRLIALNSCTFLLEQNNSFENCYFMALSYAALLCWSHP